MYSTFSSAAAFNQNIAGWNVLRVTTAGWATTWASATALSGCSASAIYTAWGSTFQGAWPTFNRACTVGSVTCAVCITTGNIGAAVTAWIGSDATTYGNIVEWNTSAVTSMADLFSNKPSFNADISKWNVGSVSSMSSAFYSAKAFNQNLGSWNVASVTTMYCMFQSSSLLSSAFNQDIGSWNTASVKDMSFMFEFASAFNADIGKWSTASVTDMSSIFQSASAFNQNLAVWNVLRVTAFTSAFDSTTALSACNQRATSSAWGSTLQAAYPTWSSLPDCTRCENVRLVAHCVG
jgi:surface protein